MSFTIIHERPKCTGCNSCYDIDPRYWRMETNGQSHLIDSTQTDEENEIRQNPDEDFELCLEVAQSCPVNIIHIVKNGKTLI